MAGERDSWCWFCGAKADLLCDGHLAWLKAMDGKRPVIDTRKPEKAQFRCDRPLCRACVAKSHPVSYQTTKGHLSDSFDYCPDCVKEGRQNFSDTSPGADVLVTIEEGTAMQRRRHFQTVKPINDLDRALTRIKELEAALAAKESEAPDGQ